MDIEKIIRACIDFVVALQQNPEGARDFIVVWGILVAGWITVH